jgi:hypothetical protein
VSNAIIASRYYLETELKDKIIEEIDILTKSVNYAIAESTNNESGISTQVNSVVDTKPADMSVMILVEEIRKIHKRTSSFLTVILRPTATARATDGGDQDQDPIHEISKYNCVIS